MLQIVDLQNFENFEHRGGHWFKFQNRLIENLQKYEMEPRPNCQPQPPLNGLRRPPAHVCVTPRAVTRWWPYTTRRRRPTWAWPYPFTRGCSGEVLFHSLLLTLTLTLCFRYRLYSRSALHHSALLNAADLVVGSHWPWAPSNASCRAAIHEEGHRPKHSKELHPVRFSWEEEFIIDDSTPSSFGHIVASSSFPMVHWYSSTHSPPPPTLRPRRIAPPSADCSSEHPTSLHPKSGSPLTELAPRPLHRWPLAADRPDFVGKPAAPLGEESSLVSAMGRKGQVGRSP
jgi:hypothetical protein